MMMGIKGMLSSKLSATLIVILISLVLVPLMPDCGLAEEEHVNTRGTSVENTFPGNADGSVENPYVISTEEDLRSFAVSVNGYEVKDGVYVSTGVAPNDYSGKTVKLARDIVLTKPFTPIGIGYVVPDNAASGAPTAHPFAGVFDGTGHIVSNLCINGASNPAFPSKASDAEAGKHLENCFNALFGSIRNATIRNVTVVYAESSEVGAYAAGLVSVVLDGSSQIEKCGVRGDFVAEKSKGGSAYVGGVVGTFSPVKNVSSNSLRISCCYHEGSVVSNQFAGGIIAFVGHYPGTAGTQYGSAAISQCFQSGSVMTNLSVNNTDWFGSIVGGGIIKTTLSACVSDACIVSDKSRLSGYYSSGISASATSCVTVKDGQWGTDAVKSALGSAFSFGADGTVAPILKDDVRYAVLFEEGAGDVEGDLPRLDGQKAGERVIVPDAILSRDGYIFEGWSLVGEAADSGMVYGAGDSFTMPARDITLVAKWKKSIYAISNSCISDIAPQTYIGSEVEPSVSIVVNGKPISRGTDYTVRFENNVNVGTATAIVEGVGQYAGRVSKTFEINPASIEKATISTIPDQFFTGSEVSPTFVVMVNGKALTMGEDYDVSYVNNKAIGTATAIVTGKGNYAKTVSADFKIRPAGTLDSGAGDAVSSEGDKPGDSEDGDSGVSNDDWDSFAPANGTVVSFNGFSYKILSSTTVSLVSSNKKVGTIRIPASVKIRNNTFKVVSIGPKAFFGSKVTKVVLGKNITTIGNSSFEKCTKLKSVSMGSKVTVIGAKAFSGCVKLTKITIPAKVKKIGKKAFYKDSKLKKITIKSTKLTKKNVGANAFKLINKNATCKVPQKKIASYKSILRSKGLPSKAKII